MRLSPEDKSIRLDVIRITIAIMYCTFLTFPLLSIPSPGHSLCLPLSVASCMATALCQLGLLSLRQLGKYATAIKHFTKALGADPSCEDAMLARAECYLELDKQSRAFETGGWLCASV